jgi:hypothetical protein
MQRRHASPRTPTIDELIEAHQWFEENEPRALFYRAASELVRLALEDEDKAPLRLAEALAVLLQTWNQAYYRFHYRGFKKRNLDDIERLRETYETVARQFRPRDLESLRDDDAPLVKSTYSELEERGRLGTVGAAKCLHLLAPCFFPLWDRAIADGYIFTLAKTGGNAENYWLFMLDTKEQCEQLRALYEAHRAELAPNLLKALDEYNYCAYHKPAQGGGQGQDTTYQKQRC